MSKLHICTNCSKELANRHSLSRHKKNCCKSSNAINRYHPYPNSAQECTIIESQPRLSNYESGIMKSIRPLLQSETRRKSYIQKSSLHSNREKEERLDRIEVYNNNISDMFDKAIETLKDEITDYVDECFEFEEKERRGGSLTSLRGQKKDHTTNKQKEDEDDTTNKQKEEEDDTWNEQQEDDTTNEEEDEDEEEEVFLDVIKKDAETLSKLINELSQHSKFTDKTAKINTLIDSYLNDKYIKRALFGGKSLLRTKAIEDVEEILKFLVRERETVGLVDKIYLLVQKIEKTRQLIKKLFWIMEIKDDKRKKNELSRTTLHDISNEEYKEFESQLNPESISRVLKAKNRVNVIKL